MKLPLLLLWLALLVVWSPVVVVVAFAPAGAVPNPQFHQVGCRRTTSSSISSAYHHWAARPQFEQVQDELLTDIAISSSSTTTTATTTSTTRTSMMTSGVVAAAVLGLCSGLASLSTRALAVVGDNNNEIEMAELPPPYVPAGFALLLLVGVGVLTGSLGNVIDDGTYVVLFCTA